MVKYKMKQTALLIVLLLSIGWIKADAMNENRIHCVVLNTQGNPIPFANVIVFNPSLTLWGNFHKFLVIFSS